MARLRRPSEDRGDVVNDFLLICIEYLHRDPPRPRPRPPAGAREARGGAGALGGAGDSVARRRTRRECTLGVSARPGRWLDGGRALVELS